MQLILLADGVPFSVLNVLLLAVASTLVAAFLGVIQCSLLVTTDLVTLASEKRFPWFLSVSRSVVFDKRHSNILDGQFRKWESKADKHNVC